MIPFITQKERKKQRGLRNTKGKKVKKNFSLLILIQQAFKDTKSFLLENWFFFFFFCLFVCLFVVVVCLFVFQRLIYPL